MTALIACLVSVLLGSANLYQLTQAKVIPYVIEVDNAGKVSAKERAQELTTTQEIIQYNLALFVTSWRTVTADIALQQKHVQQASFMSTGAAKGMLSEWYRENNPYISSEKKLVEVRIIALPLYVSGDTWLVEWDEIERSHEGVERDTTTYKANLVIKRKVPETEREILKNATGIYISEISHSKKIH